MNKFNPLKNECPSGVGQIVDQSTNGKDFTTYEKRLASLIARMALAGHSVHKLQDGFLVTRWGMSRHCPDLAALIGFSRVLGVSE
jgi:hypothetical protein